MRRYEAIASAYFLYLLVPTAFCRKPVAFRRRAALYAVGTAGAIVALSRTVFDGWQLVRDWAPGICLLVGYWLPGTLFTGPLLGLERSLLAIDARVFACFPGPGSWARPTWRRRAVREYLEMTYLLCYPLVPLTFGILYLCAGQKHAVVADRFWSPVLSAVFACYGLLPWLPTRPPRALESADTLAHDPTAPGLVALSAHARHSTDQTHARLVPIVRGMNLVVLQHVSIQVNTFPSGHVAAAVASALAAGQVLPALGFVVGWLALSIAVASVVGRYHYTADAVLGALVAILAWGVTS